jgi:acetoacetyl-CoA synthetase
MDGRTRSDTPLWTPPPERAARTQIHAFAKAVQHATGQDLFRADGTLDYHALWQWSVAEREEFWVHVWRFTGILADRRVGHNPWYAVLIGRARMAPPDPVSGPRWFAGARLNFAEHLLRYRDDKPALVFWNEQGFQQRLSYADLYDRVRHLADALRAHGIRPGDRIAAFMPNIPETVVAMLATSSLGAVWSSCSPDFGVKGVLDRFGQIAPRILFTADGYRYAGKEIDSLSRVEEIVREIPGIERVVVVPYLRPASGACPVPRGEWWSDWARGAPPDNQSASSPSAMRHHSDAGPTNRAHDTDRAASAERATTGDARSDFPRFPFDHPLYIMYSSGTTGLPKCMVHGAGGTLLQHLKEHRLHVDLRREDVIFYFTTCGWMMWNWLVSALASGATVLLYDGAPLAAAPAERTRAAAEARAPRPDILWEMAAAERVSVFGTSAKYLALAEKEGLEPGSSHDLSQLRTVLSTGSPLAGSGFDFVYNRVKRDVCLSSISGGTDIVSCFALGNPAAPVYRGELQARGLGMAVDVFDEAGRPVRGAPGELVCMLPFPSMPIAFWNDPDGDKYRSAYFEHFPGVWRHGDWAELTRHGGLIITGRSDATLNPGGVRIGTAEIYRQVELLPEIIESLVIGQETGSAGDPDVRIVLFVRLRAGEELTESLRERIRRQIRENTSPHHVPKVIVQVADIPRTISGKITELAVRDVIHGREVKNADALANPEALRLFENLAELQR